MQRYTEVYKDGKLVKRIPLTEEEAARQILGEEMNDLHNTFLSALDRWETLEPPEKWELTRSMLRWILWKEGYL